MQPVFLALQDILETHRDQIERYGGRPGVRDIDLLRSAVAMPAAGIKDRYLHKSLFEMAAAYPCHIVGDHPFIDGNKRTGAVAAVVFLLLHGIEIAADESEFEALVRQTAEGKATKAEIADFFQRNQA